MMRFRSLLVLLLLLGCAPATSPEAEPQGVSEAESEPVAESTDESGIAQPATAATRVVALTSIAADILHQLDAPRLVGVPGGRLLDQNPDFEDIPRVSQERTPPSLEAIVALEPDLVVGATGFHDQILGELDGLEIDTLTTELDSWSTLEDLTRTLATAIGADPSPLLQRYGQLLPAESSPEQTTLVLVSRQPLLSPNAQSWAGDLLTQFGAGNLAAEFQGQSPVEGYITLSAEKVLETDPDVLLLVDVEGSAEAYKSEPFWQDLKAVQSEQVHTLEYYGFVNPGSLEAIAQATAELKQIYSAP